MLENALDIGISEFDFWNMTIAEIDRLTESKIRQQQRQAKEKASYDYILANLIGRAFATCLSKDAAFPEIYEAYPSIFQEESKERIAKKEKEKQEILSELSALRFKHFAQSYNKRFEEVANKSE